MEEEKFEKKEVNVAAKKKPELKKVKVNKWVKRFGFFILVLVGLLIVFWLINIIFPEFGTFIWFNVRNPLYEISFELFEKIPRFGVNAHLICFPLIGIFVLFLVLAECTRLFKYKNRVWILNSSLIGIFIFSFLAFLPSLMDNAYINSEKLNELYFSEDIINKEYSKEDLINLNNLLVDKILLMADTFERKDGAIVFNEDLANLAISELKNSSDKYEFLKGRYPDNVGDFSENERKSNFDMTLGYTGVGGIVIDSYANDIEELNTIMHEMCHAKGINRESEAEYCSFLASIDSSDDRVVYSAYIAALARTTSALSEINYSLGNDAEERFLNLCYEKGYDEACRFNIKNIDFYFYNADLFFGRGYKIRNYADNTEQLLKFFDSLKKYDLKIYSDNKKISINKLSSLIDSGSEKILNFSIKINEDDFDDISTILKDYKTYYVAGYQENSNDFFEEDEDESTEEELEEYYLAPFNKTDFYLGFNYIDEYYYERATRFYLEYFDAEL